MSPTSNHLHLLLAAMRRYFAPGQSDRMLIKTRTGPTRSATKDVAATGYQLVKHGPIQITTVLGAPMCTKDGVTVEITAKLAWSSALRSTTDPQRGAACRSVFDKCPGRHDDVSAQALTREALRTIVLGCNLAALLCEQRGTEEKVRMGIARHGEESGLIVHLVRIRSIALPAWVQAADDARALSALRGCTERRRMSCKRDREKPAPQAIRLLTC